MASGVAVRPDRVESYEAAADLRTRQFRIVKRTGEGDNGGIVNLSGAGEVSIGILQNKPNITQAASVAQGGSSRVVADGSGTPITAGDRLKAGANGVAVKSATDKDHVIGQAMNDCAIADQIIGIDLGFTDAGV